MLQEKSEIGATQGIAPEIESSPSAPAWRKNIIFTELELTEMALAAYEQAIQLAPHEAILHYHKGQVLEHLGRISEAQQAYAEARNLGHAC
jgi:tetratricopeptide (TPR) repeat protein